MEYNEVSEKRNLSLQKCICKIGSWSSNVQVNLLLETNTFCTNTELAKLWEKARWFFMILIDSTRP